MSSKRILVAALNWGLGHATRSIPIIDALLAAEVEPFLAADGAALEVLKRQYPELPSIELPSYDIHYRYDNMFINMGLQLPKILSVIHKERSFVASIISKYKIDALISDNRYGVYHPEKPSILLTHQLFPKIPNRLVSYFVHKMSQRILGSFDMIWVPDYEEEALSLSGALSHGQSLKCPLRYLGPLSRLKTPQQQIAKQNYAIVALLSGPEPQRSYLERKLIQQLSAMPQRSLLIRGQPLAEDQDNLQGSPNLTIQAFMQGDALAAKLLAADWVIARSGYSSLMDFVQLGLKQVLFVPTPGQTEQLYLAQRCFLQGNANWQRQGQLNLQSAWAMRHQFGGWQAAAPPTRLPKAIDELLHFKK